MKRFITIYLLVTIAGGVFITSGMFYDMYNEPKFCLSIIALLLLFILCCFGNGCIHKLQESLSSRLFTLGVLCLCLVLSVHAILQYTYVIPSHSFFRITGTFDNPSGYSLVQSILLPFSLQLFIDKCENSFVKTLAVTTVFGALLTILLSGSRCGIMACCTSSSIILLMNEQASAKVRQHKGLTIACLLLIVAGCLALYFIKQDSADGRLLIWNVCLDMIAKRPLLGYGPDGFQTHYMDFQAAYFEANPDYSYFMLADNVTHPFNEFVLVTVNYGIVGLLTAFCLTAILLVGIYKSVGKMSSTWFAIVASLFVFCLFSYPFNYPQSWIFLLLSAVIAIPHKFISSVEQRTYLRYLLAVASFVLLCLTVKHAYLNMRWAEMSRRSIAGQTKRMLPHYKEMLPQMSDNPMFLYNYAAELNYVGSYEESLEMTKACMERYNDYDVQILLADNLENIGNMSSAVIAYSQALNMVPCRFVPMEGLLGIYQQMGDTIHADSIAYAILQKPVKIQSFQVDNIRAKAKSWLGR
jgi:O-antigen polymerase